MSGFQLVASLASSLAWPVIVMVMLIFVWSKRDDIQKLFSPRSISHGRTLKRLRAGPVELEWDQLIESTAEQVSESLNTPITVTEESVKQELGPIANSVPAAAVLEAFARVERRLRKIFDKLPYDLKSVRYGMHSPGVSLIADILSENGLISREIRLAIYNLNQLRNEAAHRVGEADITTDQANEYLGLVDSVLTYLKDLAGGETSLEK
jgi:hypothetical protein